MFCSRTRPALLVALFTTATFSCSQRKPAAIQRLAVLRFENLTGDDSLDWMGRAASEIIADELDGARGFSIIDFSRLHASDKMLGARPKAAPGVSAERPAAMLAGASRVLYGRISRAGARLRLDAVIFDTSRQKIETELSETGSPFVIPLADALAKQLGVPVRPFGTRAEGALREYCRGLESPDPRSAADAFSRAVAADPNFGPPYMAWAQLAAVHDRAETERILGLGAARGSSIGELEQARIVAMAAELRGDLSGAAQALTTIARLHPTDASLLRKLAQANLGARRYQDAAGNIRAALAVEPENVELWNDLGYAEMFAGDLPAAAAAVHEYQRIRPSDANALDSLGDVYFYFGRFSQAEQYYLQAFEKDNAFNGANPLFKAAHAHLRTGDVPGADAIFRKYDEVRNRAKDPLTELRRAEWEFLSGRKKQAMDRLETIARALPAGIAAGLAPQASAQLAVWELELGDRAHAREFSQRAQAAQGSVLAATAQFLTDAPVSPDGWKRRTLALLPRPEDEPTRNLMLAYALLLQKDFSAAVPVLTAVYQRASPDPQGILPVLLGWVELETGHTEDAARLLERNPIPNSAPELFDSLAFPRLLLLRSIVLEKQGKTAEALKDRRLFATLSGPAGIQ